MRVRKAYKKISVTQEVYDRLIKDRDNFQKVIGAGKWSISDTINEYFKIMKLSKAGGKR